MNNNIENIGLQIIINICFVHGQAVILDLAVEI